MSPMTWVWLQFAVCVLLIGTAGYHLAHAGDMIARRTGLSGSWIGLALVATVTSLPELSTGITSVTLADVPNVALGDALGSCVINLAFLIVVDFLHRAEPLYSRASQGHILAAGFGVILLGFIGVSILMGQAAQGLGRCRSPRCSLASACRPPWCWCSTLWRCEPSSSTDGSTLSARRLRATALNTIGSCRTPSRDSR